MDDLDIPRSRESPSSPTEDGEESSVVEDQIWHLLRSGIGAVDFALVKDVVGENVEDQCRNNPAFGWTTRKISQGLRISPMHHTKSSGGAKTPLCKYPIINAIHHFITFLVEALVASKNAWLSYKEAEEIVQWEDMWILRDIRRDVSDLLQCFDVFEHSSSSLSGPRFRIQDLYWGQVECRVQVISLLRETQGVLSVRDLETAVRWPRGGGGFGHRDFCTFMRTIPGLEVMVRFIEEHAPTPPEDDLPHPLETRGGILFREIATDEEGAQQLASMLLRRPYHELSLSAAVRVLRWPNGRLHHLISKYSDWFEVRHQLVTLRRGAPLPSHVMEPVSPRDGDSEASPTTDDTRDSHILQMPMYGGMWSLDPLTMGDPGTPYYDAVFTLAVASIHSIPNVLLPRVDPPDPSQFPAGHLSRVGDKVIQAFKWLSPQHQNIRQRQEFRLELEAVFREGLREPTAQLYVFGSSAVNVLRGDSDLDFCLLLEERTKNYMERSKVQDIIQQLYDLLVQHDPMTYSSRTLKTVMAANVPILRRTGGTGNNFDFDISLSFCGVRNSMLLRKYVDSRLTVVQPLTMVIIRWSKEVCINDTRHGFLSSYTILIMILYYLIRVGEIDLIPIDVELPLNPQHSYRAADPNQMDPRRLGGLLVGFFAYYAQEFDVSERVVSLRSDRVISKGFKKWDDYLLAVEDPYETHLNTARHVGMRQWSIICTSLHEAHNSLVAGADFPGTRISSAPIPRRGPPSPIPPPHSELFRGRDIPNPPSLSAPFGRMDSGSDNGWSPVDWSPGSSPPSSTWGQLWPSRPVGPPPPPPSLPLSGWPRRTAPPTFPPPVPRMGFHDGPKSPVGNVATMPGGRGELLRRFVSQ